jgi:hypothetical protein
VQRSAAQRSAVQCGAAQCSAVQCGAAQFSAVQCSAVLQYINTVAGRFYFLFGRFKNRKARRKIMVWCDSLVSKNKTKTRLQDPAEGRPHFRVNGRGFLPAAALGTVVSRHGCFFPKRISIQDLQNV